ncbi:MAG: CaiB/BaiF CoA transferase family protein [Acidimicrobiales bacterium]
MTYPLDGIRVLDLSQAVSGPYVGRLFADLGADVVKVEWPRGDLSNLFGKSINGLSGLFTQMNAGKRGVGIDLSTPAGAMLVRQLAARADVVIENFRPGVLARAGLGYDVLAGDNPGVIVLSISGFGQSGAAMSRRAYAPVIHAEAGLIDRQASFDGRPPTDIALALADSLAGLHGAVAVLAALALRTRSGAGQHIDLSMLDAMLATDDYTHNAIDGEAIGMIGRGQIWDAKGGRLLIAADLKTIWAKLSKHVGLVDDDADTSLETKITARSDAIAAWIASYDDRDELIAELAAADLAWADVRSLETVLTSRIVADRDVVAWVDDGAGGRRGVVRLPYRFSDADCDVRGSAPERGRHNEAVLSDWLGLGPDDVVPLRDAGALS